jgi:hypothetical protein
MEFAAAGENHRVAGRQRNRINGDTPACSEFKPPAGKTVFPAAHANVHGVILVGYVGQRQASRANDRVTVYLHRQATEDGKVVVDQLSGQSAFGYLSYASPEALTSLVNGNPIALVASS